MTFHALRLLLQGYLNQDWPFEYGDPWLAVDAFVLNEPLELSTRLVREIEAILSADPSEAELKALVMNELNSGYTPNRRPRSGSGWLNSPHASAMFGGGSTLTERPGEAPGSRKP